MLANEEHLTDPETVEFAFAQLEGSWQGEGQGFFPTIDSFAYRETLTFERPNEATLSYTQRTQRQRGGVGPFVNSHWESGFVQAKETGVLELANVQSGGRGEVLRGHIERDGELLRLVFKSASLSNDARMVATARTFTLEGDVLRYEMGMHTTGVAELLPHVTAVLQRVK
jgi:THAP domain-containing protein 4